MTEPTKRQKISDADLTPLELELDSHSSKTLKKAVKRLKQSQSVRTMIKNVTAFAHANRGKYGPTDPAKSLGAYLNRNGDNDAVYDDLLFDGSGPFDELLRRYVPERKLLKTVLGEDTAGSSSFYIAVILLQLVHLTPQLKRAWDNMCREPEESNGEDWDEQDEFERLVNASPFAVACGSGKFSEE